MDKVKALQRGIEVSVSQATSQDYIHWLVQEGDYQSSGRFSLEAKKALQKMQAYQLHQPAEYVIQLISCPVMRNARQIQIEIGGRDVRVGFDGEPFSDQELEQIFECCQANSQRPVTAAGAHLAIALQAMKTYDPDVLIVESGQGKTRNVLQLYEQDVWIESLSGSNSSRKAVTYVGMEHSLNFFNFCFPSLVGSYRAERTVLRERAYAAPIPVYVNGSPLQINPENHRTVIVGGPPPVPGWAQGKPSALPELPFWGLVRIAPALEWGKVVFIQGGVAFSERHRQLPEGVTLFLLDDTLQRDLSHQTLINNEAKAKLLEEGLKAFRQVAK